jgi:hypothetical protein
LREKGSGKKQEEQRHRTAHAIANTTMHPSTHATFLNRALIAPLFVALLFAPGVARGQASDSSCAYATCALNIVPRLSALDVVKGSSEDRVGSLAFLFPRGVTAPFAGNEVAQRHAQHAFSLRRVASVLTDVGAIVAISASTRAVASTRQRGAATTAAIAGGALVASSIPIHFAADRELSRAVWEYNRRFSR